MRLGENFAETVLFEKLKERLPDNVGILRREPVGQIGREQERNY